MDSTDYRQEPVHVFKEGKGRQLGYEQAFYSFLKSNPEKVKVALNSITAVGQGIEKVRLALAEHGGKTGKQRDNFLAVLDDPAYNEVKMMEKEGVGVYALQTNGGSQAYRIEVEVKEDGVFTTKKYFLKIPNVTRNVAVRGFNEFKSLVKLDSEVKAKLFAIEGVRIVEPLLGYTGGKNKDKNFFITPFIEGVEDLSEYTEEWGEKYDSKLAEKAGAIRKILFEAGAVDGGLDASLNLLYKPETGEIFVIDVSNDLISEEKRLETKKIETSAGFKLE